MFLHSWQPNPVLLSVGGLEIYWYGLFLAIGAIVGYGIVVWLAKKYNYDQDQIFSLVLWLVIIGLIGARLYHVTNEWSYYANNLGDIVKIWNGGLAIHGAILFDLFVLWWFANKNQWDFWLTADIIMPGLVIGQAIGRWGNYFNQELFGRPTELPWGIPIESIFRPLTYYGNEYFHPTFLYESLGLIMIFLIMAWFHRQRIKLKESIKDWSIFCLYGSIAMLGLGLSALLRIGTELLRIDQVPIIFGVRLPIITSILIIIAVVTVITMLRRRHHQINAQ